MFATSQDLLNLALAIGFGLLALFGSVALYYLIFVLRDLSQTTKVLKNTTQQLSEIIIQPARLLNFIIGKVKDVAGIVDGVITPKKSRRK